jgi:putative spermidine/putrescine transport system permease protein
MLVLFDTSFRKLDRSTFLLSDDYTLANYQTIFDYRLFFVATWRGIYTSLIVAALVVLIGFPYAYVMVRTASSTARKLLLFCLFLPFFIGQVVRAYAWIIVLGGQGMVNSALVELGFEQVRLLYTPAAVIVGSTQYMLPFAVLLMAPALSAIPEEIELAAEGLGANWLQTFRHVVIPLAMPGIVSTTILVFTLVVTDFAMPAIMGGGRFDFMANVVYDVVFSVSDLGLGAALTVFLVTIASICVFVLFLTFETLRARRRTAQ